MVRILTAAVCSKMALGTLGERIPSQNQHWGCAVMEVLADRQLAALDRHVISSES